ncbi:MAG: hypothetical protein KGJ86_12250 [Chloroflexota bacterium]|nr:hypothetical protein [Chloroflexota bacterium]
MTIKRPLLSGAFAVTCFALVSCGSGAQPAGSASRQPPAAGAGSSSPVGATQPTVSRPSAPAASAASASAGVAASTPAVASAGGALAWNFDRDAVGGLPKGAEMFSGSWAIRAEADTPSPPNALCQTGNAQYPAMTLGDATYANLSMSTRFKPLSGKEDQAAGLIFRVQDKANYYIVRANALENNVMIFKYQGGRRSTLKSGSAKVATGKWQELRADVNGDRIRGFVNGRQIVEANDGTFKSAGRAGLWAKSDSVTCFDDVSVTPAGT